MNVEETFRRPAVLSLLRLLKFDATTADEIRQAEEFMANLKLWLDVVETEHSE